MLIKYTKEKAKQPIRNNHLPKNTSQIIRKMCPKRSVSSLFDVVGSGVNQLRELGWETGTFEQQFRDRFQQIGKITLFELPVLKKC